VAASGKRSVRGLHHGVHCTPSPQCPLRGRLGRPGGKNWTNTTSFNQGAATDVIIARFNDHTLFAGLTGTAAGVFRSDDDGVTWNPAMNGISVGTGLTAFRLASGSGKGVVYVSYLYSVSPPGIGTVLEIGRAKTTDDGHTWKLLASTPGGIEKRPWHLLLGVDPKNDKHVFVNDAYSIYESIDSGGTWTKADVSSGIPINDDWVNVAFDAGDQAVFTADRTIYRYDFRQQTWQCKEGNLQITLFYDLAVAPTNPDVIYGVAQDDPNAMQFSGSVEWAYVGAGNEMGKALVDPSNTSRVYVSNPLTPSKYVVRSADGGVTWTTVFAANAFKPNDYFGLATTQKVFALDPSNSQRLLVATNQIWETKDATAAGPAWNAISAAGNIGIQYITALAIAPSDPKRSTPRHRMATCG
jgi:hypothetical protein